MSKKGENIYRRKDGRWEARCITGYDEHGHAQYRSYYGKTYREAREKLNIGKFSAQQEEPYSEERPQKPFGAYCDEWLDLNRARIRESTYAKYEGMLEKWVKPELGACMSFSLSAVRIGRFGQTLLEQGLSAKTVRDTLTVIHSILAYMQTQEAGMRPIKLVYPKEERKETRVLTREEQEHLMTYLLTDTDPCKFGVLLALLTGLRIGELCALRWQDISLSDETLQISATMMRLKDYEADAKHRTKVVMSAPKSDAAVRTIPLTDYTVRLCEKWMSSDPEAFVLTGKRNQYLEPRALQYRLKKYTEDCGLAGVHFHTLRHTFATRCIEVGFELRSLSEVLGHTNTRFTLERYVHSSMELKRHNMEKLTSLL